MLPNKALESSAVLQVVSLITTVLITVHLIGKVGHQAAKEPLRVGGLPGLISAGSYHFLGMFRPWTDPTLAWLAL